MKNDLALQMRLLDTSIARWARQHNLPYRTVYAAVTGEKANGPKARRVLKMLRKEGYDI